MTISNSIVCLRAVEPEDLDTLYILENATGRAESGFSSAPHSRYEIGNYITNYSADIYSERQLRLMIVARDTGHTVGAIDIADYEPRDRRGFVGIAIVEDERRRGYGKAALALLCDYASEVLGLHQLVAQVAIDNEASRGLFTSCGFKSCGKLRSWIRRGSKYTDVVLFQRIFPG